MPNASRWLGVHRLPAAVLLLGLLLTAAITYHRSNEDVLTAAGIVETHGAVVAEAVERGIRETGDDLVALAALFESSELVTEEEFRHFAGRVITDPAVVATVYVPLPGAAPLPGDLEAVLLETDDPSVLDGSGSPGHPIWREAAQRAMAEGRPQASAVLELSEVGSAAWVIAPITEPSGVVGSLVALADLVNGYLPDQLDRQLDWMITDVTSSSMLLDSPDRLRTRQTVPVGIRRWSVEVVPTALGRSLLPSHDVARGLLLGGLATALAALSTRLVLLSVAGRLERQELRRLAREKDQFLASISHELRTPLTVVVGMTEVLDTQLQELREDEVQEFVHMLRSESSDLAALVDDLLLVGRLDAGAVEIRPEPVDLRWEVERIVMEIDRGDKELTIRGEGWASADPLRLRQILRNLYANAVQHGGSRIAVEVDACPTEATVTVSDDGTGVLPEARRRLFDAHHGSWRDLTGPPPLGIGLSVAFRLSRLMDGRLSYRREHGRTAFVLNLPPATEAAAGDPTGSTQAARGG